MHVVLRISLSRNLRQILNWNVRQSLPFPRELLSCRTFPSLTAVLAFRGCIGLQIARSHPSSPCVDTTGVGGTCPHMPPRCWAGTCRLRGTWRSRRCQHCRSLHRAGVGVWETWGPLGALQSQWRLWHCGSEAGMTSPSSCPPDAWGGRRVAGSHGDTPGACSSHHAMSVVWYLDKTSTRGRGVGPETAWCRGSGRLGACVDHARLRASRCVCACVRGPGDQGPAPCCAAGAVPAVGFRVPGGTLLGAVPTTPAPAPPKAAGGSVGGAGPGSGGPALPGLALSHSLHPLWFLPAPNCLCSPPHLPCPWLGRVAVPQLTGHTHPHIAVTPHTATGRCSPVTAAFCCRRHRSERQF